MVTDQRPGWQARGVSKGYTLQANAPLRGMNTFGVDATAAWLLTVHDPAAMAEALAEPRIAGLPLMCIGEGSNLLLVSDLEGVALRQASHAVRVLADDGGSALVRADAGHGWDALVDWSLGRRLSGLENLALIPGLAGAAPIQNIGAYGTEVDEFVEAVETWDRVSGRPVRLPRAECGFTYRDSRFKHEPDRWIVTAIELKLPRERQLRLDYPGVREELGSLDMAEPGPADVAEAVRRIRRRKIPDPAEIGNAGSFFKNPIVPRQVAEALVASNAGLPTYPADAPERRKLSAAWMIEACGWRGYRDGEAGVSSRHALVLVNHGNATGAQILSLAQRVAASVHARFGVRLVPEPRIIGADFLQD
jgi:UDP-N-acetylmuramate dehydrogenase